MSTAHGDEATIVSPGGRLTAVFLPAVNLLCRSLVHDGDELLDGGHGLQAYAEHGKTMGIPLLHPWANRLAEPRYRVAGTEVILPAPDGLYPTDSNGLPIHGALPGLLRWRVDRSASADRLSAHLDWGSRELLELFPFPHELHVEAVIADESLTLTTTLLAGGEGRVPVAFGYHPYLGLPGLRESCRVELGATQRLVLDGSMIPTGAREPLGERAFALGDSSWDDGLDGLDSPAQFTVAAGGHRRAVHFEQGYPFAQVFAPSGRDFICFEPMTAPANALDSGEGLTVLEPGAEYRATFRISLSGD